ncbi:MAG TPA: MFS transporter [Casimicrobiaceae bacterium]|nr:MFS transporter [Casimicrobiaceae bacterium]
MSALPLRQTRVSLETVPVESLRRDVRIIGLVGTAHAFSHFFQLALPPLFPFLRMEFDVSWTALGLLVGTFYAGSAITQFAAGFVVDRAGAKPVLLSGLALLACGTILASAAPGAYWLFPIAALMGVGNGVFHPADFAILNANVAPKRLGYAYSTHGIGGNLGYALSPVVSFTLAAAYGWRVALAVMGLTGLVALGVLASQRGVLLSHKSHAAQGHDWRGSLKLFMQPAIALCFGYFAVQTMASVGLQTFLPSALNVGLDVPLGLATSAVTAYLLGATVGIAAGGYFATRTTRHDRVAATGLLTGAGVLALVASGVMPLGLTIPALVLVGFAVGSTGPSRDMIVRNATPRGASGRVYGFVYSGLDLGAMIGPVWFGLLLDHGLAQQMIFVVSALLLAAVATVLQVRRSNGLSGQT